MDGCCICLGSGADRTSSTLELERLLLRTWQVLGVNQGFPCGSVVKKPPAMQESQEMKVQSRGREDPLEEEMAPTPVFLPGEWTERPRGLQSMGITESDMTEQLSTHASDIQMDVPRRQLIHGAGTLGIFKS